MAAVELAPARRQGNVRSAASPPLLQYLLHLPALRITDELERVRRSAKDLDLAVRGFHGEGTESTGDFFQISNQITLGVSEDDLLQAFATCSNGPARQDLQGGGCGEGNLSMCSGDVAFLHGFHAVSV